MNVVWAFVIGIIGQFSVLASCYRLDKYVPKDKYFGRSNIYPKAKPLFVFTKKTNRHDFMTVSIIFQITAYFFMGFSLIVFVISLITANENLKLWSTVLSFILIGYAVLENLFEMIVLEMMEIRGEHID
jgi:hypothetical protein